MRLGIASAGVTLLVLGLYLLLGPASATGDTPRELSDAALASVLAADCDECCDPTGGGDCPGVEDSHCETLQRPQGQGGGCTSADDCEWAPEGDDDAECEWLWPWQEGPCSYIDPIWCSQFRAATCSNKVYDLGEYGIVILCECVGDALKNKHNNSRKACEGSEC